MSKNPWMKFYPADWRADEALRLCSLAARGLWIEMIALMHKATPYGSLAVNGKPLSAEQLAGLVGCPVDEVKTALSELEQAGVFSRDGQGTIYSRRMKKDEKKAKIARNNGKSGGNPSLSKQTQNPASDNQQDKPQVKGGVNTQIPDTRSQKPESPLPPSDFGAATEPVGEEEKWLFGEGVDHLVASGIPRNEAKGTIELWLGMHPADAIHETLVHALTTAKAQPVAWVGKVLASKRAEGHQSARARNPGGGYPQQSGGGEGFLMIDQNAQQRKAELWAWREKGRWNTERQGPRPGEGGCRYDAGMIAEMLGDDAAVQALLARRNGEAA